MASEIPLLLLKTKSSPHDAYEECFSTPQSDSPDVRDAWSYSTHFVPVLTHSLNTSAVNSLGTMLRQGSLKQKYGGMIFTSQRAVEAWAEIVRHIDDQCRALPNPTRNSADPFADLLELTPFPLYVVGPATERALSTLIAESLNNPGSYFRRLGPSLHGAESGNGAKLAQLILHHYNRLYDEHWFSYFEAPRLPFIPLLGMSSQNYGRKRLDHDDPRLQKKPLCFLVGETRRDIIPKTLQNADNRIEVDEIEVYTTQVMESLSDSLTSVGDTLSKGLSPGVRVIVIFSPQGSEVMLKHIGWLDQGSRPTALAKQRWWQSDQQYRAKGVRWVVATIGPTTRDFLKSQLDIVPDISADKPTPDSLRMCIQDFLREHNP